MNILEAGTKRQTDDKMMNSPECVKDSLHAGWHFPTKRCCIFLVSAFFVASLVGCGGTSSQPQSVQPPPVVTVSPPAFTMGVGSNYQFSASVTGVSNTTVTWRVNGTDGGSVESGTIDSTGLYIAPTKIPSAPISVIAVAQADGVTTGQAAVMLLNTDPAGSATAEQITCPSVKGINGGQCYALNLSCPGLSDLNGYVVVNVPAGAPVGTVMLTTGAKSEELYWSAYAYGPDVIDGLLQAGFVTIQTSFGGPFTKNQPDGWQTGPGGVRRAACRYATLAKWVYDNVRPATVPLCATGNSSGSQQIGYALAHYGLGSIFTMVEPTSGPPFSRVDYSCECNQPDLPDPCGSQSLTQCVGLSNAQLYVDPAYSAPICSQALQTHNTDHSAEFFSDSIQTPDASVDYPNTYVHFLWGGLDDSSAPVMGQEWQKMITSKNSFTCVADAPHDIADALDAAKQIVSDMVNSCHF
jgi:hypothetical protein